MASASSTPSLWLSKSLVSDLEGRHFPLYRNPNEIGFFSCDSSRCYSSNIKMMQELEMPVDMNRVNFDLSDGYEDFIRRDETDKEYIDYILMWVLENMHKFYVQGSTSIMENLSTDFICWRGLLTRIICSPYENQDGWIIAVQRIKGTYYLCEFDTEKKRKERFNMSDRHKLMTYWGYRFEHYMTKDFAKNSASLEKVVINNSQAHCGVYRSRLNSHSIVFPGELDCIDSKHVLPKASSDDKRQSTYVELKTSRIVESQKQDWNLKRYKMIKWWAQNYTPNIPHLVCGYRDDDGMVRYVEHYHTAQIPKLCQEKLGRASWQPSACMNFLDLFLSHIKRVVTVDSYSDIHVFSWSPSPHGSDTVVGHRLHQSPCEFQFLPDWFLRAIRGNDDLREISRNPQLYSFTGAVAGGSRGLAQPRRC